MATIDLTMHFECSIDGERRTGGSLTTPVSITVGDGVVHDQTFSLATATSQELFDVADDIGDFDFLWIESDQDIWLELVIDDNGTNGESYQVIELLANVPFVLASDDGLASDGTVTTFDGTADLVERITADNDSGSTAKIRVFAAT